jgi:hypothetical protein
MKLKYNLRNINYIVVILLVILIIFLIYNFTVLKRLENLENISSSKIPNQIWTYWDTEELPDIVQKCVSTWRKHNPNYKVVILNKNNLSNYLTAEELKIINHPNFNDTPARYSDTIRVITLSKYGGFWIDASIICQTSFDWVHEIQQKENVEVVGYYIDKMTLPEYKTHSPVIESWFFACTPDSSFVKEWRNEFISISNHTNVAEYLKNVQTKGTNIQNIENPHYLAIHVSAQKVLQSSPNKYSMHLLRAEDTAFKYLEDNNWIVETSVQKIVNNEYRNQPILKLRSPERNYLKTMDYPAYFNKL